MASCSNNRILRKFLPMHWVVFTRVNASHWRHQLCLLGTPQPPAKIAALPAKHMLILRTCHAARLPLRAQPSRSFHCPAPDNERNILCRFLRLSQACDYSYKHGTLRATRIKKGPHRQDTGMGFYRQCSALCALFSSFHLPGF